ncbi:MAG TPA: hypothetical protein VFT02_04205 [Pyrinomonadaceae bacterium]|nr:hypothetical protein [Pyrinomonadaceae bacterium]
MHRKVLSLFVLTLFLVCGSAQAQSTQPAQPTQADTKQADTKEDQTNLQTQLYMIVGSNQDVADTKMPAALDPVLKELRATLPFKSYRLAAVLVNRVKNEGRLEVGWIGVPYAPIVEAPNAMSRSSYRLRQVRLTTNNEGQSMVQLTGFNFGAQIAVPTGGPVAGNNPAPPAFNYEGTNLSTDISVREGEPAVVGTLNAGPSGDAIILVVSVKRTQK